MDITWAKVADKVPGGGALILGLAVAALRYKFVYQRRLLSAALEAKLDPGEVLHSVRATLVDVGGPTRPKQRTTAGILHRVGRSFGRFPDLEGLLYLVAPGQPLGPLRRHIDRQFSAGFALGFEPDDHTRWVGIDPFAVQADEIALVEVGDGRVLLHERGQPPIEFAIGETGQQLLAALGSTSIPAAPLGFGGAADRSPRSERFRSPFE